MSEIKLCNEIITALEGCKNAKEVMAVLKCKGYEVTEEKAGSLLSAVQNDLLDDEDLDKIVGGQDSNSFTQTGSTFVGNTATQGGAL